MRHHIHINIIYPIQLLPMSLVIPQLCVPVSRLYKRGVALSLCFHHGSTGGGRRPDAASWRGRAQAGRGRRGGAGPRQWCGRARPDQTAAQTVAAVSS